MGSDEVRSVYFILAAVYKLVRASRTTSRFDCTKAEAPVLRKCYENFGEQGWTIGYDVEGSVRRCSRDVRHKRSHNHRHACVQRTALVDEGPIDDDTLHLHAAVPLFGPQQGENVR